MFVGVTSMFVEWAAVGVHRGCWLTRVAISRITTSRNKFCMLPSVCPPSHTAGVPTTNSDAGQAGGRAVVHCAIAPCTAARRSQELGLSFERHLLCTKASLTPKMESLRAQQGRTAAVFLGETDAEAVSFWTRKKGFAPSGTTATSTRVPNGAVMASFVGDASQHPQGGSAPPSESPLKKASSERGMRSPESPAAGPISNSPPLPPSSAGKPTATSSAQVFSFCGNPHDLQERLRGAKVVVFFHNGSCVPCDAIRPKLLDAVAGAGVGSLSGGATVISPASTALSGEVAEAGGSPPLRRSQGQKDEHQSEKPTSAAFASSSSATNMVVSDQGACNASCRPIGDVTKTLPHPVIVLTVDTNANTEVTALHDIRSLPTCVAYRNGCIVGRVEGSHEDEIKRLVEILTEDDLSEGSPSSTDDNTLHGGIKKPSEV
ncbi:hypothetical protein JKF63_00502 [Porcisia hertigi]|uniref:Thioredoxin n=1 Tax=Porcisia hertigi TaxID=2761500 RepID=A0A836HQ38_9TRYP|nr:hypothetical protein JKF63_00502 [Porcisia hertigi]